jgi:hypothetical protein
MADETPPSDPQGTRRRRPPTVIELAATEIPSESAAPEKPQVDAAPPSDPPPEAPESSDPPSKPEPSPGHRSAFTWLPEPPSRTHLGAGLAGIVGGLLVALVFWLGGALSRSPGPTIDLSPRLASIEKQLDDLAARPEPANADRKALDDIAARLGRLEGAQAAPRAPVTDPVVLGRLNAAESATKSLSDNVTALSRRAEAADAALRESNGKIESKIDKLTAVLAAVQSTAREAAAGSDRASRLAVATSALRNAVEHGDPFAAELAIVKPLATDANAVALLEPFAASGVPSEKALGQELAAIVRPMLRPASEPPRDSGFLDRLQANAEKLVRIRPVAEEPRGDDRGAVLTRIEQRATQGEISSAGAEIKKLPPEGQTPFKAWIARADARNKALDASRRLAAAAVAALKAVP